eukprot:764234-Hanusia_phi.AAC.2
MKTRLKWSEKKRRSERGEEAKREQTRQQIDAGNAHIQSQAEESLWQVYHQDCYHILLHHFIFLVEMKRGRVVHGILISLEVSFEMRGNSELRLPLITTAQQVAEGRAPIRRYRDDRGWRKKIRGAGDRTGGGVSTNIQGGGRRKEAELEPLRAGGGRGAASTSCHGGDLSAKGEQRLQGARMIIPGLTLGHSRAIAVLGEKLRLKVLLRKTTYWKRVYG